MTPTPHGQVPEALIDLIDAYAETRHRYGRIHNAKTEAARNAVVEALSGVQALSAAPAEQQAATKAAPASVAGQMQFGGCPECGSRSCVAQQCSRTVSHSAQVTTGVQWQCGQQASGFAAPQQEAQEPVAYVHVPHYTVEGKVRPVVSFEKYQQDYDDGIYSTRIPLYAAPQPAPAPLSDDTERLEWLLWKLPGDALRYVVGELADTSSGSEFRAAIDAAIAAPKAAPGEQNTVPAEWLEQAYREGWAACRDAETIWEEAEDWAFGNSTANSRMIDAQQAAPQQEAQEPCGWTTGITWRPDTRLQSEQVIKITRDTQPKYGYTTPIYIAPQPAPAPLSDDTKRLDWLDRNIFSREMSEWDAKYGHGPDYNMWVLFSPKGAHGTARDIIDAALAAQGGK